MSPFDRWPGAGAVFTGSDTTFWPALFSILAAAVLMGFIVRVIVHENHAYEQLLSHVEVEEGPVVEGEPPVY